MGTPLKNLHFIEHLQSTRNHLWKVLLLPDFAEVEKKKVNPFPQCHPTNKWQCQIINKYTKEKQRMRREVNWYRL